jgi:hypothetical protein
MNSKIPHRIFLALSLLVVATAAATTGWTLKEMATTSRKLTTRGEALEQLRATQADMLQYEEAHRKIDQANMGPLVDLNNILNTTLGQSRPESIRPSELQTVPGWRVRQKELSFDKLPVARLMQLVRMAEAQRPPWRLVRCVVRASSHTAGTGKVVLLFEGVERSEQIDNTSPTDQDE